MKRISFGWLLLTVLLHTCPAGAQNTWSRLSLTGSPAKIIRIERSPRFHLSFGYAWPTGAPEALQLEPGVLQNALFNPVDQEQWLEILGGPAFLGEAHGDPTQPLSISGNSSPLPQLRLAWSLGRFEATLGAGLLRQRWTGAFPVTVWQQQDPPLPQTRQGTLQAERNSLLFDASAAYFPFSGRVQPFLRGGLRSARTLHHTASAELAGIEKSIPLEAPRHTWTPFAGAGARLQLGRHLALEAGCSWSRLPAGRYRVLPELSAVFSVW